MVVLVATGSFVVLCVGIMYSVWSVEVSRLVAVKIIACFDNQMICHCITYGNLFNDFSKQQVIKNTRVWKDEHCSIKYWWTIKIQVYWEERKRKELQPYNCAQVCLNICCWCFFAEWGLLFYICQYVPLNWKRNASWWYSSTLFEKYWLMFLKLLIRQF